MRLTFFLRFNIAVTCAFSIGPYPATRSTPKRTCHPHFSTPEPQNSSPAATPNKKDTKAKDDAAIEKATKAMTAFTNKYLANTGTTLCADKSVAAVVIVGLAEHKVSLGSPLCPCRFYDDKEAEARDGFWNCPCVPMRERHECHCMLFLTEDNAFAGKDTNIEFDEVLSLTSKDMD